MEKEKILIIDNTALIDKKGVYFVTPSTGNLVKDLLLQNYKIELFQFKKSLAEDDLMYTFAISNLDVKITTSSYYADKKFYSYIISLPKALKCLWRNDFIYFFYPCSFRFLALIALLFGKKVGFNIRGEKGIYDRLSCFLYKKAKVIFTVSPHFTSFAKKYCKLVFNKRPTIEFSEKDVVLEKKIVPKSTYRLLFLARLDLDKGILDLLNAVRIINERKKVKVSLLIVGDGQAKRVVEDKILNETLDNVSMYGAATSKEEIENLYENCDLYVLPSYHEGFPRTLYEAMICKTPIMTTFVGGISCLMKDDYNCFKILPHDPIQMANRIEEVLKDTDSMNRIADNAMQTCLKYFKGLPYTHGEHLGKIIAKILG